jgi:pimeloyl-ACP methyl ester carboxylesterase/membrane protease YdiL (CAAX protease family)
MGTSIRRHPLLAYYVLTFVVSWTGFVLVVGRASLVNMDWQAEETFLGAVMVMLAGPSVAGLLLIGLVEGAAGYRNLVLRLLKWRVGLRWYAFAILPAPIVSAAVLFALSMASPLFTAHNKTAVLLGGLGAAVTTILEEVGWTGFAVPRLRRRHTILMTGVIAGVLWGLWHVLQQVFISGTYAGGIPLAAFLTLSILAAVASLTAYRVLMVWLYDRTGSLLVTTLMHGMLTASSIFWFTPLATGALFLANVWLVAAALWIFVGAVAVFDGWPNFGRTEPFRQPDGRILPNSVAQAGYERIGGIDQWVLIRGESVANPLLIVLHGGPGMSEMGFFRHYNAALERHFTVVQWDQRGAGKSFARNIPRSSMTLARFVADLDELVDLVRERFGTSKVAILGHSWGSALGAIYAARYPAKVSVYVGAAQIGDSAAADSSSYAYALAEAKRRGNEKALTRLRAIGPPPYSANSVFVERTIVNKLDGQMRLGILLKAGRALFGRPESSIFDLPNLVRGFRFTLDAMWAEVSRLDLLKLVPSLKMPVVIVVGRRDHWVPPETSVAYFDALSAPSKQLVWFEESGHEAFVDEPEKFNSTMAGLVRPLAAPPAVMAAPRWVPAARAPKGDAIMRGVSTVIVAAAILGAVPAPARADSGVIKETVVRLIKKTGVHGNVSYRHPLDSDVTKGWGVGASVGLSPGHTNGWRYPFALTFFTQNLHGLNGDTFASVRTRALLGGIGYGWHFGRLSTGVQLQAGYALNHVSVNDNQERAFNVSVGPVSVAAGDSWLLRPAVKAEYFITPKFTVRVSGDYVYMRPDITVTTPFDRFERRWDQSNLHANFGIAFYPFRR